MSSQRSELLALRDAALEAQRGDDLDKARRLYDQYLRVTPRDAGIWTNLGALYRKQKRYALAALCQRRALALDPENKGIWNNASNAFYDAGFVEEALEYRQKALLADPDTAEHHASAARYLRALDRVTEAESIARAGIAAHPKEVEPHLQLAFALLGQGRYAEGFEEFNWRWQGDELKYPDHPMPQWQGEDLSGKTILVTPEQGFGDTLLMARFVPELQARAGRVLLACKPPLRRLLSDLVGQDGFCDTVDAAKACDVWTPIMDLPRWLAPTLDTVPPPPPVSLPEDAVRRARAITAPFSDRLRVGVLWSGSVTYRANHKRSFGHQAFLQLADIPGLQMFSLYKGPLLEDYLADGTASLIINAAGDDRDFADTAALIRELDLVVTMDSAVAHVAGSMGAPVWNLLHSEPYWLYQPYRDHTPWYPSMRLIRQEKSGDWQGVFDLLHRDISALAAQKRTT